ncbi:hypothetical protein N307_09661, partial [Dryobates pubescens]
LFKELVKRIPWETALRDKGAEQSWWIFKDALCRAQKISIPTSKKLGKEGKRPPWLSCDLLVKLKGNMGLNGKWKEGQASWEEHRDVAWLCRNEVRKAKAQLELNLARDVKKNKKGFCRHIDQKRKVKENVPLMSNSGELVSTDEEKAEILNNFFASVFTDNPSPPSSCVDGPQEGDQGDKVLPTVCEDRV